MALLELGLAIRALQDRSQPARLDLWRQRSGTHMSAEERMAVSLIPSVGYSPSYLGPSLGGTPEELLDYVRARPRQEVEAETAMLADLQPLPSWARHLANDAALYQQLSDGLDSLHTRLLSPYWGRITDLFTADRTLRMRQMLSGGVEALLSQANPRWMRWKSPVLEIRMPNGADRDLVLEGQGVLLVPSVFSTRSIIDPEAVNQPTVSYPAGLAQHPLQRLSAFRSERDAPRPAVSALLGQTRSAVLHVIAEHPGCSTKELAALAAISPASASEHATILREAGLIQTIRHRNAAVHSATSLGISLLNAPYGPSQS